MLKEFPFFHSESGTVADLSKPEMLEVHDLFRANAQNSAFRRGRTDIKFFSLSQHIAVLPANLSINKNQLRVYLTKISAHSFLSN
jgi:hypothetical protein